MLSLSLTTPGDSLNSWAPPCCVAVLPLVQYVRRERATLHFPLQFDRHPSEYILIEESQERESRAPTGGALQESPRLECIFKRPTDRLVSLLLLTLPQRFPCLLLLCGRTSPIHSIEKQRQHGAVCALVLNGALMSAGLFVQRSRSKEAPHRKYNTNLRTRVKNKRTCSAPPPEDILLPMDYSNEDLR